MNLITKHSDYAVRALCVLADRQAAGFVSSSELAGADGIPLRFLRRILRGLMQAGYIRSREGVSGGVCLARRPEQITVADVIRLFQGPLKLSQCMFRRRLCARRATCVLRRHIIAVEECVNREFQSVTIADLCREQRATEKGRNV